MAIKKIMIGILFLGMIFQVSLATAFMPLPYSISSEKERVGSFSIDSSFTVTLKGYTEPRLQRAVSTFLKQLSKQTNLKLEASTSNSAQPNFIITTHQAGKKVQELGEDESYVLEITESQVKLTAPTPLGTLHGLQTFLQMVNATPTGYNVPTVTIKDKPRFAWRGLMIDSVRHFMPLDVIRRNLDGMAAVKLNVFHWHLSDDQGFRVESKRFPKLHQLGSDGHYYSQAEIRQIIEYAQDRGIRVVPEFDMPGHSTSWFVGYPELASGSGPYHVERHWAIFDTAMDPTNEEVYTFLDTFIMEMSALFPDAFFHIGGDEVTGKEWDANLKIQAFMKEHELKNNEALQAYFSGRVQQLVTKYGKTVIGWDEVLVPGVSKDIVIQSWRGESAVNETATHKHRVLLSNGYYLDHGWTAARHYAVDPAANVSAEYQQYVLGGEACMWSEYVSPKNIDSRIWPRTAAIAERFWSAHDVTDINSLYERMPKISAHLATLGLTHQSYYQPMLQKIAGHKATPQDLQALRTLTDVLEPVKDYTRGETAPVKPTSTMPMNRVVDAVSVESIAAREFSEKIDRFLENKADKVLDQQLRDTFILWRDNDAKIQSLAKRSAPVKEVALISNNLATLASIGLNALDHIAKDSAWKSKPVAALEEIKKPKIQLLIIPTTSVQKLVDAVR